ncbi:hypothetical protein [Nakamurella sp. PAMC28650]|uniref:hypothetical protein n=1 Tax=Nakamurella sp. PAMC28650 TaxID=2762325 RepID=UPI00164E9239|nr:hypothetical protein [Nakamurella sp. PAMC28650]QNK82582.1 hypothetical protein H7F38_07710 [Nakamurella sp. PAMC28650]
MKIKLKTTVSDYEGKPITQLDDQGKTENVTFRQVINAALNNEVPGAVMTPEDKQQIYQISKKIWDSWTPDLSNVECAYIQTRGLAVLNPLLSGRLDDFLNQRDEEVAQTEK